MMSYRLACDAADVFAGVAPVAGTLFTTCRRPRLVSLLHIHGLVDQNIPFAGGVGSQAAQRNPPSYPPVRSGVLAWVATDGCGPSTSTTTGPVTTERWTDCRAPTAVELITIADGGHSWPGGQRLSVILDPPSRAARRHVRHLELLRGPPATLTTVSTLSPALPRDQQPFTMGPTKRMPAGGG